ncbi:MAG: type II toxin-antitoxin system VapC family toxin [Candidatus Azotimanducaceae bacterium WSBS_2022_MAG_OTU7]
MEAITKATLCLMSAANCLESAVVVDRQRGAEAGRQFDALIARAAIQIEPVTREQADIARQAYLDFGKGRHPASLNFGDCFAYALARSLHLPLLFKGNGFSLTDIEPAL